MSRIGLVTELRFVASGKSSASGGVFTIGHLLLGLGFALQLFLEVPGVIPSRFKQGRIGICAS